MFDKNNIGNLMQHAQKMQEKINKIQKSLDNLQVQGESGAGLVKIIMNGKHNCIKIHIDTSLIKKKEKEILEDLIVAAFNDANRKIDEEKKNKISNITPGMPFSNNINSLV
ncbi:YbaB/EbfC family nucleoid-associated protein [Buchnera aphidicola]|uniref:Nucleoid-associated protein D9V81_01620 n=1 Tax=Buchnera aphidicola (Therioaphis trifolii) TaxID=1241884 RepID=A0A4D6YKM1_9GAMM|nr:YbaB/EbfC family nucleoid-associated protein [Buchnera aphidicola]QCI27301.1 YbaB/EbfC family nucleoid-associated protein [Buchnera aphidicola (Therioaphis trifolii)]